MSEKKSREPPIRWSNTDIVAITSWFCHRDKKGVAINYHAWTTENHLEQADRMLIHTELHLKPRVTKKKAADKLVDMIKLYKDWRGKAVNTSGWGLDEENHEKKYLDDGKETGLTIKAFLLKKCPWYYAFDGLYGDHPTVNPAGLVESDQPARSHGRAVRDEDFGGGDESEVGEIFSPIEISSGPDIQGAEDGEEDTESTHSSLHSTLSQIARDERRTKRYEKRKSSNPRIKIENHQDKTSSMEEETPKKKFAPTKVFFLYLIIF